MYLSALGGESPFPAAVKIGHDTQGTVLLAECFLLNLLAIEMLVTHRMREYTAPDT